MNKRMRELMEKASSNACYDEPSQIHLMNDEIEKFAELIVRECIGLLFDESERLYAYSSECDNMRESDEAELVAEKCVDLITMIEEHFGVEESVKAELKHKCSVCGTTENVEWVGGYQPYLCDSPDCIPF